MQLNVLDYIIIGILILSLLSGLTKGFIQSFGGIVSIVLAIVLAAVYYDNCAIYLEEYYGINTLLADFIRSKIPLSTFSLGEGFAGNLVSSSMSFVDTAHYLSFLVIMTLCFILIFLLSSKIIQLIWKALDSLFSWGILSWINKALGMLLVLVKNYIIMAVVLGALFPVMQMGAQMGLTGAIISVDYIKASMLATMLIDSFTIMKALLGINV